MFCPNCGHFDKSDSVVVRCSKCNKINRVEKVEHVTIAELCRRAADPTYQRILVIKVIRDTTGMSLRSCKNLTDAIYDIVEKETKSESDTVSLKEYFSDPQVKQNLDVRYGSYNSAHAVTVIHKPTGFKVTIDDHISVHENLVKAVNLLNKMTRFNKTVE